MPASGERVSESPMLAQALDYAARGWPVLPLHWPTEGRCSCGGDCGRNAGKHPLASAVPRGKHDATTDAATINDWWARWPDANIGLVMGDGLLALDVDPRHGGQETLRDLERELGGGLPDTVTALTGGEGQHLIFAARQDFKSTSGALGPGLDVKCAGGYIVAPPSRHVSGRCYEWEAGHGPDEIALASLPPAIAARLREDGRRTVEEVGERIPEGQRHDALVSLAGTMRRRGMTAEEIGAALLAVNERRCDPPLPEREVQSIAASAAHWPSAEEMAQSREPDTDPPDAGALLHGVQAFIRRYVVLSDVQADALVLWTVHTWAFGAAETTPYLSITSAEKRSGKSRLLEALSLLVARPWPTGRVTAAVLVRKVAAQTPTLLLDESDAAFRGEKEYAEALRAVLDAGWRSGGVASLCVKAGKDFEPQDFPVFGPKAIAGIGRLPDTVADRAVPIVLKRRAPNEPVTRFRWREAREEAEPIGERLECWASANLELLLEARPEIPPELDDRAADSWEPLLAIADAAGGNWPERARKSALALSVGGGRDDDSLGVRLLRDIQAVFEERKSDRIASVEIADALARMEEAPWGDLKGKVLDARALAWRLRPYGIRPHQVRFDDKTLKGYEHRDFEDAWRRYTPRTSETRETSETKEQSVLNLDGENVSDVSDVSDVSANSGVCVPLEDGAAHVPADLQSDPW